MNEVIRKYSFGFLLLLFSNSIIAQTFPFNSKVIKGYSLEDAQKAPAAKLITAENKYDQQYFPFSQKQATSLSNMWSRNLLSDTSIKIIKSPETELPLFIGTPRNSSLSDVYASEENTGNQFESYKELSLNYLSEIAIFTKVNKPNNNFIVTSYENDNLGFTHVRMNQIFNGMKVYGNEVIVHLAPNGRGISFNGKYDLIPAATEKIFALNVSSKTAVEIAINDLSEMMPVQKFNEYESKLLEYSGPVIDTTIYKKSKNDSYAIVYHITIHPNLLKRFEYFIDTKTGEILNQYESSCSIDGPQKSVALDLNNVSRTVNSYLSGSTYVLRDVTKQMYNSSLQKGAIETLDQNYTYGTNSSVNIVSSITNSWTNPTAVSAHLNAGIAYDYFLNNHARNSIDGKGGDIRSLINIVDSSGKSVDNAFWNGKFMSYGNGNILFKPLAGSLDVAGHEMTHGVVAKTASLEYLSQSGAINESMADIFGCMIDSANWTLGEDIIKGTAYFKSGVLRSLKDPHNGGTSKADYGWQPKHMSEYFYGESDNYGVHTNSGIPNYAFYLLATSTVGRFNASKIYYRALSYYLTSKSQFIDLRLAVIQAAKDLFPSTDADKQAAAAFDLVGILDATSQKSTLSKTIQPNPGNEYLLSINTDPVNSNGIYRSSTSGNNLIPLAGKVANNRISITDNGQYGVYIGTDKKMYSIITNPSSAPTITLMQSQPIWGNVAISKDGKRIAAVTSNADTSIWVYDYNKTKWYRFKLYRPTFLQDVKSQGPVFADGLDWDFNGEYIIYDCLNRINNSTGGTSIQNWDINAIHIWDNEKDSVADGMVDRIFDLEDGENIGNPVLSKNSPYIMAFDYFNTVTNEFYVGGYNFEFDDISAIYKNNTYGYPSFNRNDDSLAFTSLDINNKYIVNAIKLNSDKISSSSTNGNKLLSTSKWPNYLSVGARIFYIPTKPSISISGQSTVCTGNKVLLTSSAKSGNQWYLNGVAVKDSISSTFYANVSGSYTVVSTIGSISSDPSASALVSIVSPPTTPLITTLGSEIICQGGSVVLSCNSNYSIQWYKDGQPISGAINSTYTAITPGKYTVAVSNVGCQSLQSSPVNVTINALPTMSPSVSALTLCQASTATGLTASASTGNTLSWYGTSATGGTASSTAPVPSTTNVGITDYYVSERNPAGCDGPRSKLSVSVISSPSAPQVSALQYCKDVVAPALTAISTTGNVLYWYGTSATGGTSSVTAPVPTTNVAGVTDYYVVQKSSSGGCESGRSKLTVTVNDLPVAPTVSNIGYCKDATASSLSASATSGNAILWYGTNATGGTASVVAPIPSTTTVGTTDYYVSQRNTGTGCEGTRSKITVTIATPPAAPDVAVLNVCQGGTTTALKATPASGNSLLWFTSAVGGTGSSAAPTPSSSAVGTTDYFVSQVSGGGCVGARAVLTVNVNAIPTAPAVSPVGLCQQTVASALTATASSGHNLNWYGSNATGGTGSTSAPTPSTSSLGSVDYYVSQFNINTGCESPRSKLTVTVNNVPGKATLTRDGNGNLVSDVTAGNQWYKDGVSISGASQQSYKPSENGNYTVKITQNGCTGLPSEVYYYLTTALINLSRDESIHIYPNPVKDIVNLGYRLVSSEIVIVQVYDESGKLVAAFNDVKSGAQLNLARLITGRYILMMTTKSGRFLYRGVLIKH